MRINEIFSTRPDLKWDGDHGTEYSHGHFETSFEVGSDRYLVMISQDAEPGIFEPEVWDISFRQMRTPGFNPTGNMGNNATKVFGGVVSAVEEFINTHKPNAIGLTGKSRNKLGGLYVKMTKALAKKIAGMGYSVVTANARLDGGDTWGDVILLHREGTTSLDYITPQEDD